VGSLNKTDQLYRELLADWLWVSRREAMTLGGLVSLLGMFDKAYADAEFQIQVSPQKDQQTDSAILERPQDENASRIPSTQQDLDKSSEDEVDIGTQLGLPYRAPTCGLHDLTSAQLRATATAEKAPDYLSVAPSAFSTTAPSRMFLSGGEAALATASRSAAPSKVNLDSLAAWLAGVAPPGVTAATLSIGRDFEDRLPSKWSGFPGATPIFLLAQFDISSRGRGGSVTFGGGTRLAGLYVTKSTLFAEGSTSWSLGAYAGNGNTAGMFSINLTELTRGEVTFEGGVIQAIHQGLTNSVEFSVELRPADAMYNSLYPILEPLSNPETFQDPFSSL
jgi:hypothetical protein